MIKDKDLIIFKPIGYVKHNHKDVPRHYNLSDLVGDIIINKAYLEGLLDIKKNSLIVVLFYFHKSKKFTKDLLRRVPPHGDKELGVFSICSPNRPNPIGLSILRVIDIVENKIHVKHIDMLNETPILDIKPYVKPVFEN
ncbi:MAG: tRNA (N6-threonylcarbamoyladenosine(37)-N6)-methyltransferase TrmO [Deferribacterota bacterium]|nr:tRNA (N6-threonylcarbamoyladenosine(37)-N6)-methyltransferase TrmO [Deferribacterota bacterium]